VRQRSFKALEAAYQTAMSTTTQIAASSYADKCIFVLKFKTGLKTERKRRFYLRFDHGVKTPFCNQTLRPVPERSFTQNDGFSRRTSVFWRCQTGSNLIILLTKMIVDRFIRTTHFLNFDRLIRTEEGSKVCNDTYTILRD